MPVILEGTPYAYKYATDENSNIEAEDAPVLVAPKTKVVDKTTKLIVVGAVILIAVVIYMKIKKGK
jgi:hypothetical protein